MVSLFVDVYRGKLVESKHQVISLVKDIDGNIILSTNNENDLIFPRSSIKLFQAIPFIISRAPEKFDLNNYLDSLFNEKH